MDFTINRGAVRKEISSIYEAIKTLKSYKHSSMEYAMAFSMIQGRIDEISHFGLISLEEHDALFYKLLSVHEQRKELNSVSSTKQCDSTVSEAV